MLLQLKTLLNPKEWIKNFFPDTLVTKWIKHASAAIVGLLGSTFFTLKVKPYLDQIGISIDAVHLAEGLTVLLTGLTGSIMNWAVHIMDSVPNQNSSSI